MLVRLFLLVRRLREKSSILLILLFCMFSSKFCSFGVFLINSFKFSSCPLFYISFNFSKLGSVVNKCKSFSDKVSKFNEIFFNYYGNSEILLNKYDLFYSDKMKFSNSKL